MALSNFKQNSSAQHPRIRRRKIASTENLWDTGAEIKRERLSPMLWLPLFAAVGLLAVFVCAGFLKKWETQVAPTPVEQVESPPIENIPVAPETAAREAKMAIDCVAAFLGSPNDLLRVAQCRQVPKLVKILEDNKAEIARLVRLSPTPGGNIKRRPPFIGIPILFANEAPRTAWVEIQNTAARLDLESFVGYNAVAWTDLESVIAGTRLLLRGTLVPINDKDDCMELNSPNGKSYIRVLGKKPAELKSPRTATVTVERVAETPLVRKGWRLVSLNGWDWLAEKSESHSGG